LDLKARSADAPDGDLAFADSLRLLPSATAFALEDRSTGQASPLRKWGLVIRSGGADAPLDLPSFAGSIASLTELEVAAAGNGSINLIKDADGVLRRAHLLLGLGGVPQPTLAAELLRIGQAVSSYVVRSEAGSVQDVRIGQITVQTGREADVWLHFTGYRPERFLSAARVLQGDFDPSLVQGHLVLVGITASGLRDQHATAIEQGAIGVEIHAEILEQLLLGTFLVRPDWADGAEILYLAILGALLVWLLGRLPPLACAAVGAINTTGAVVASLVLFRTAGILVDPLSPSLTVLAVYVVATAAGFAATERERRHVRRAFERYLAPTVVERLVGERDRLELGGETRELTVLFGDIRGFTTVAENLEAQALTRLVNRCMTPLADAVLASGGTVDKFMGDALMAFWNAPLDVPDHALQACRAALRMSAAMADVNRRVVEEGILPPDAPALAIGIGMNTGLCSVGNMGSEQRFDYSAIGDPVNLASRLEGLCRLYGVDAVIGEATAKVAPGLDLQELDLIRVKGKERPERVFALLDGETAGISPGAIQRRAVFATFLAAYRSGDLEAAEAALPHCREVVEPRLAQVIDLYAERLAALRTAPPGPGWDGVFTAREK